MQNINVDGNTIVVAEKDAEVRHLLSESLRLRGYQVVEFESPADVDIRAFSTPPALFLLGHGKSDEETFEALETLRQSASMDSVPVVVMAVDPDDGFLTQVVSRGADGLIPFPSPMEDFHAKVDALINGGRTSLLP